MCGWVRSYVPNYVAWSFEEVRRKLFENVMDFGRLASSSILIADTGIPKAYKSFRCIKSWFSIAFRCIRYAFLARSINMSPLRNGCPTLFRQPQRTLKYPPKHQNLHKTHETFHWRALLHHHWEMMMCSYNDWAGMGPNYRPVFNFHHPDHKSEEDSSRFWSKFIPSKEDRHCPSISIHWHYIVAEFDAHPQHSLALKAALDDNSIWKLSSKKSHHRPPRAFR